jgi:hypothetical protein
MNAISIVSKEFVNPKTMVADITIKMPEKSAKVIPQNRLPKIMDTKLIATLVSNVMTIRDLKSMWKLLVFPKSFGRIVPICSAVLKRPLNKPLITPLAVKMAGYTAIAHAES